MVIMLEQASQKLTAQLHQAALELKDVRAERYGLQADIQRLRESTLVCSTPATPCCSRAHGQASAPNKSW